MRRVLVILTDDEGDSNLRDHYECGVMAGVYDGVRERLVPYPRVASERWREGYRHGLTVALRVLPELN